MKKIASALIWVLLVSMFAPLSVFAASETKIETKGGYVTLSNIVKEVELIKDKPEGSSTAYISEGPVKLTMVGDDPHPGIQYTPEAYIEDGVFMPSSNWKPIEISGNSVTFSDPGYYFGGVYFGPDFSSASTVTFVIQVVNSGASSVSESTGDSGSSSISESAGDNSSDPSTMPTFNSDPFSVATFEFGEKNSGYTISFPDVLRFQRIQGFDEELGNIDVDAAVLRVPECTNDCYLRHMDYIFESTNPDAHRAYISFESYFGGQVGVEDMTEIENGMITSSLAVSPTTIEMEVMKVRVEVFDQDGNLLFEVKGADFIFDSFDSVRFSRTDLETLPANWTLYLKTSFAIDESVDETAPSTDIVSAKPTSSKVMVNGKEVSFQAYNINNNNYFKLRDLAMVLNGTEKSFAVGWNGEQNAISLESGKPYKVVGGELVVAEKSASEKAQFSSSAIYLDGKKVELTAYLINGNNYFKLRDLAADLDFGVTWDASSNSIVIDTSSGYVPEG